MAKKVTTLYVEDSSIKLLVTSGRQVDKWASVPLEAGLVSGGVILNENAVAGKINELFTTIKLVKSATTGGGGLGKRLANIFGGQGKLIIGLSGRDSLYRVIALPTVADNVLAESVRREAGRVLPVSLDELYLAYQRIPGFANESRIFVAAFPKNTADTLFRTLRLAGITPRFADLAPLALCLSVNEPRSIVVDVRQDNLSLIVMAGRVPQVIRSLALQSEVKTISENLPTIIEEFSRTVAFYNSSHQQEPLDSSVPVFVSSDLADAPDSWKALVGKLDSKVAVLPSVIQYPANFPANEFAINLGLAAKELNLDKEAANYSLVNLNALPASLLPKQFNAYRVLIPVVAVAGIASLVFLWMMWQDHITDNKDLESQLTTTQAQIAGNAKDIADLTEQNRKLEAQIQPILDYAGVFNVKLDTLEAGRTLTDSDLHQIVALEPDAVAVTGVTYNTGGAITVNGVSADYRQVLNYAQNLRDSGGFTTIVTTIKYEAEYTEAGELVAKYTFSFQMK
ncbi:MAG TPA: PilN domain-containing protein [Dehalococcoidales bacterium]